MTNSIRLQQILLTELGFAERPELRQREDIPWPTGRAIPHVDSAFLLEKTPLAYFSRLNELDEEKITELHRNVWSQSKAPLLFITLPHEIRVYNSYQHPDDKSPEAALLRQLSNLTDELKARKEIKQVLEENQYERLYLETGAFWGSPDGRKISHKTRADQRLINGMKKMRDLLVQAGLSNQTAYTLLGRSVFIRYLEDRGILSEKWFREVSEETATNYREILAAGRKPTYHLFKILSRRFNGDLFPIEATEQAVNDEHTEILQRFLNASDLETGQLSLWPYNFAYVPIELISQIYDTFIEDQRSSGAYYTPLPLVDFILEETMGEDVIQPDMTVLDPACGSGIFLVGAFRRLVQAHLQKKGSLDADSLKQILEHNIFGVDVKRNAVRIATFSLYLEILNHLSNEQIQNEDFRFPTLIGSNLISKDFFSSRVDEHFGEKKFHRVVGNLPWGISTLSEKGAQWLQKNDLEVGGKQAAPAFMLRIPKFCRQDGEIAVLTSTKSSILVSSHKHIEFRQSFFEKYHVRAVSNFSAIRRELFENAVSPSTAVFYTPDAPQKQTKIVYAAPKPSPLSLHLKAIILDTTEIKFLSREKLLETPDLWKVAQWGTPRDAEFINRLRNYPTLLEQADSRNWLIAKGIQVGIKDNKAPWLVGLPLLSTLGFQAYSLDENTLNTITNEYFHRPRKPIITKAPLILVHKSKCAATYVDYDIAYRDKIMGVIGSKSQKWVLLWLTAYLNSSLAKYYHFLTSTGWAVERRSIVQGEYEAMPFFIPEKNNPHLKQVLARVEQIRELLIDRNKFHDSKSEQKKKEHEATIDQLVYEIYNLHPTERQLVEDTLEYTIPFFEWSKTTSRKPQGTKPVQRPDLKMMKAYAEVFIQTAVPLLKLKGKTLAATVYKNGAPLTAVTFSLRPYTDERKVTIVDDHRAMQSKLRDLERLLLDQKTPTMYMRRHVRVYDKETVSLVRPSEQRFWTQSQARTDADAFIAELSDF